MNNKFRKSAWCHEVYRRESTKVACSAITSLTLRGRYLERGRNLLVRARREMSNVEACTIRDSVPKGVSNKSSEIGQLVRNR